LAPDGNTECGIIIAASLPHVEPEHVAISRLTRQRLRDRATGFLEAKEIGADGGHRAAERRGSGGQYVVAPGTAQPPTSHSGDGFIIGGAGIVFEAAVADLIEHLFLANDLVTGTKAACIV
jgi:hypothetical protein